MPLFRQRKKSYEAVMLASNPVSYYPLSETGTTCYDLVGGRHLTVGSTMLSETLSERAAGRGFKFGGGLHRTTASTTYTYANAVAQIAANTDDYWHVTETTAFARAASGISVAGWVKVPKNASAINAIWSIGNLVICLAVDATNTQSWSAQSRKSDANRAQSISTMGTDANVWVHLCYTLLDHSSAKQKIWVNGSEVSSYSTQDVCSSYYPDSSADAKGLCLGGYKSNSNVATTVCGIAHLAFYTRVLTAAEMLTQYNLGKP